MKKKPIILGIAILTSAMTAFLLISHNIALSKANSLIDSVTDDFFLYNKGLKIFSTNPDYQKPSLYWSFWYEHKSVFDAWFIVDTTLTGEIIYPTQEQLENFKRKQKSSNQSVDPTVKTPVE